MSKKNDKVYYVDKEQFSIAVDDYAKKYRKAQSKEQELPIMSDYIGNSIMKIAYKLSSSPKFNGYSYKDEMISDGIENVIQYLSNFNPVEQEFRRIVINIFLQSKRIKVEEIDKKDKKGRMINTIKYSINPALEEDFFTIKKLIPKIVKLYKKETVNKKLSERFFNEFAVPFDNVCEHPYNFVDELVSFDDEYIKYIIDKSYRAINTKNFQITKVNKSVKPNAFSYVTQIIYFAFLRRLEKEKKQEYIREKSIEHSGILADLVVTQDHDDTQYYNSLLETMQGNLSSDYAEKKKKKKD